MPNIPNSTTNYQEMRLSNQELHQKQAAHYEDTANDIFIQLTRLVIFLNTFLLTFTSPIFIQIKEMPVMGRILLFIGWIFLLISIIAGIIQLIVEEIFYQKLTKYYFTIAGLYSLADNTEEALEEAEKKKTIETIKNFKYQSSNIPFAIQIFCFIAGLIFILIVFYNILF
jgi:hypothetical protein